MRKAEERPPRPESPPIGPGRKMLRTTEVMATKNGVGVQRMAKTRPHRVDGTVATKPPLMRRAQVSHGRNSIAKASRKANR